MKLTKNQKHFLKTIKDKNVRKYQKQQFKLQNEFECKKPIVFKDGVLKTDNIFHIDFLSQHPMNGSLFKEEVETSFDFMKGYPWYGSSVKEVEERFNKEVEDISRFYNVRLIEDFLNFKPKKISELPFKTFNFSSANLSDLQIEKVIEWMNTWEQLKDTAIPIRFKEDFTNKKFEFKGFDSKNYRFSPKGEIGDKLKVEKILPKEDVDTFKKEIQSMISADISHLTFTTELNNGNFVFYKDNHKPFEYSGKISEMTFSDKLAIVEKIESYAEELDVNLKPKGKFIIPK